MRTDSQLVQIVDAAFADAARRAGEWLVCRPGCTQCCVGVFAINALDAERLRRGFQELAVTDPERTARVRKRAQDSVARLSQEFPGYPRTGILDESEEAHERFEQFGNEEPCPALDPETGRCDVYAARPMTCRLFGPPLETEDGIGACELCFHGATDKQIADCVMTPDPDDLEAELVAQLEATGARGETIIAWVLSETGNTRSR